MEDMLPLQDDTTLQATPTRAGQERLWRCELVLYCALCSIVGMSLSNPNWSWLFPTLTIWHRYVPGHPLYLQTSFAFIYFACIGQWRNEKRDYRHALNYCQALAWFTSCCACSQEKLQTVNLRACMHEEGGMR